MILKRDYIKRNGVEFPCRATNSDGLKEFCRGRYSLQDKEHRGRPQSAEWCATSSAEVAQAIECRHSAISKIWNQFFGDCAVQAQNQEDKVGRSIGDDFTLMDDNRRPHRANLMEDSFSEERIVLKWNGQRVFSRHEFNRARLGRFSGRRVAGRQPPPQTLQELERALLEEWDKIPQPVS
ncbi:transposable element Tcb2 transposase [Trichonephila clavipes]|nr:transposable element Tcb2 transposase [Trichonephila clavipes]